MPKVIVVCVSVSDDLCCFLNVVLLMLINVHRPYKNTYEMNIITVTPTTLCLIKIPPYVKK